MSVKVRLLSFIGNLNGKWESTEVFSICRIVYKYMSLRWGLNFAASAVSHLSGPGSRSICGSRLRDSPLLYPSKGLKPRTEAQATGHKAYYYHYVLQHPGNHERC